MFIHRDAELEYLLFSSLSDYLGHSSSHWIFWTLQTSNIGRPRYRCDVSFSR